MPTINATELARNTREILDRVSSQGETVTIQRNQTSIAQIVPSPRTMSATQALEGLGHSMLSPKQSDAWLTDSKEQFSDAVRDPWA
jgi:antitoxin (DNA-binding transcriptional repressor) of toxin-antitoxin stability system